MPDNQGLDTRSSTVIKMPPPSPIFQIQPDENIIILTIKFNDNYYEGIIT